MYIFRLIFIAVVFAVLLLGPRINHPNPPPIEYGGLEPLILTNATPLSPLHCDITTASMVIEDLLEIVTTSELNGHDALFEQLLALRNETRGAAYDFLSIQMKANTAINQ
jgi:hypothetical protein